MTDTPTDTAPEAITQAKFWSKVANDIATVQGIAREALTSPKDVEGGGR